MADVKKIDLKRFQKTMQGLIEFATLLEQASTARRQNIMDQVYKLDPLFLKNAMRKVVFFEELVYLEEGILAEILSKTTPRVLAYALKNSPEEFKKELLRHLSYTVMKQTLDEEDQIKTQVSTEFVQGAQRQILKLARQMEAQNRFVYELPDCPRFHERRRRSG